MWRECFSERDSWRPGSRSESNKNNNNNNKQWAILEEQQRRQRTMPASVLARAVGWSSQSLFSAVLRCISRISSILSIQLGYLKIQERDAQSPMCLNMSPNDEQDEGEK